MHCLFAKLPITNSKEHMKRFKNWYCVSLYLVHSLINPIYENVAISKENTRVRERQEPRTGKSGEL